MATPRKRRRKSPTSAPSDDFRDQLDALRRTKPDTDRDQDERPLTPREEYRAALDDFNNYSNNNETLEALRARGRLDRADRNRRRWWRR